MEDLMKIFPVYKVYSINLRLFLDTLLNNPRTAVIFSCVCDFVRLELFIVSPTFKIGFVKTAHSNITGNELII